MHEEAALYQVTLAHTSFPKPDPKRLRSPHPDLNLS